MTGGTLAATLWAIVGGPGAASGSFCGIEGLPSPWLLFAEGHLTRRLFGAMLDRIWALPVPTG